MVEKITLRSLVTDREAMVREGMVRIIVEKTTLGSLVVDVEGWYHVDNPKRDWLD